MGHSSDHLFSDVEAAQLVIGVRPETGFPGSLELRFVIYLLVSLSPDHRFANPGAAEQLSSIARYLYTSCTTPRQRLFLVASSS
jgi:hypothetical protein